MTRTIIKNRYIKGIKKNIGQIFSISVFWHFKDHIKKNRNKVDSVFHSNFIGIVNDIVHI